MMRLLPISLQPWASNFDTFVRVSYRKRKFCLMNQDNLQLETFQHLLSFCFCLSIYFFSTIVNGLSEKGFRALAQSGPVFFEREKTQNKFPATTTTTSLPSSNDDNNICRWTKDLASMDFEWKKDYHVLKADLKSIFCGYGKWDSG